MTPQPPRYAMPRPLHENAFKVQLAQRAIVRAVNLAAGRSGGVA
jgi:hypothetical protein